MSEEEAKDFSASESKLDLVNSLRAANDLLDLVYENKFQDAYYTANKYSSVSMVHAHAKAFISVISALLTLEKEEVERANRDAEKSLQFASKKRKSSRRHSVVETVTSLFSRGDPCKYSDEELHAELICGECNVMLGLLTFFGEQSIKSLFKGALRMTSANSFIKYCNESLRCERQWDSEEVKMQFESGVFNALGVFNLVLSLVPKKIMRIISLVGFSGNKEVALELIRKSSELTSGIRCRVSVLAIAAFAMYFEQVMGVNEIDNEWIKSLLDFWSEKFPKAVFVLIFVAKYYLMRGEPIKAISEYNKCLEVQNEWQFISRLCLWDLGWCFAALCDWKNAVNEVKLLSKSSFYSPAVVNYEMAVFKMMQIEESNDESARLEVDEIMKSVLILKRRFAGKSLPQEKFVCTRASQYFDENRKDALIALMELFYILNNLCLLKTNELADPYLRRINEKLKLFEADRDKHEQIALLNLMKGVIFGNLNEYWEAIECFQYVIDLENAITKDTFVVPHALLELGITYLKMGKIDESRLCLKKVKSDDFNKYLNESIVNLRVSSALRQLDYMESNTRL